MPQCLLGLITHHKTELYFDERTNRICHTRGKEFPKNLALQIIGRRGRLLVFGSFFAHVGQINFLTNKDTVMIQRGISELNLDVDKVDRNVIALRADGCFISADEDGIVRNNRNWCKEWELYEAYEIDGLCKLPLIKIDNARKASNCGWIQASSETQLNISCHSQAPETAVYFTIAGRFCDGLSLAAVNLRLALQLEEYYPGLCRVIVNDLPMDKVPLRNVEKLVEMSARPEPADGLHVVIHQRWPITAPAPRGDLTIYYFFWEESKVPANIVETLNRYDGVIVSANFIRTALISSGLSKPVTVVGFSPNLDRFAALFAPNPSKPNGGRPFTFLHVSSCFPQKGVDLLLQAYARAFRRSDPVRLIIKGYPNYFNNAAHHIATLRDADPDIAEIIFINDLLDEDALLEIYRVSDVMVLPTRGEGFNIPAAEAIAAGLRLIVTGFGGHMDYCIPKSARFIKYEFAQSTYQVPDGTSLLVEPDLDDLCAAMQEARDGVLNADKTVRDKVLASLSNRAWIKRIRNAVDGFLEFYSE